MSVTPIAEARRALTLATKACLAACRADMTHASLAGRTLLESLHRFVRTIENDAQLARVAYDGEQNYGHALGKLAEAKVKTLTALRATRRDLEARFPVLTSAAPGSLPDSSARPLEHFDDTIGRMLANPEAIDEGDPSDPNDGAVDPADILWTSATEVLSELGVAPAAPGLPEIRAAIASARESLTAARTESFVLGRVHPIGQWCWLQEIVSRTNPKVGSPAWHLRDQTMGGEELYYKLFFEPGHLDSAALAWLERLRLQVAGAIAAVDADFQARLGARASIDWLVRRYAERCRQLRARELRAVLDKVTRQKERALTREMATYLFDRGIDVLIEVPLGASRYDVYSPAMLLEAKVCSEKQPALTAIAQGLKQITAYKVELRSERATVDLVLVLFCVGGRPVVAPDSYVIGPIVVSIVVVDVAPPSVRGHRAKSTVVVTTEQIDAKIARLPKAAGAKRGRRR